MISDQPSNQLKYIVSFLLFIWLKFVERKYEEKGIEGMGSFICENKYGIP